MATIIEFPVQDARAASRRKAAVATAEVVIFPGIRYEYWEERTERVSPSVRRVNRDLLEVEG